MGSGQSAPKITAQDKAILDLKLQRDKLKQYQKKIQVVLDREHEIAKMHLAAGQKDRAKTALRQRKYQQGLLVKTDGQLETLEHMVSTIEFSLVEVSVLHGLKQGNDVLKEIHKEMNPESVEKLLEETHEAQAYQREIDEMLSNTLSMDDEEDVLAELQALEEEAREPTSLPSAPTENPIIAPIGDKVTAPEKPAQEPPQPTTQQERIAIPA